MAAFPDGAEPASSLFAMIMMARDKIRETYGDPQLAGIEGTPYRPLFGVEVADTAQQATDLVRSHIGIELVRE